MPDPITDAEKAAKLTAFKHSFNEKIDVLADNLRAGKITLGMWEEDMRTRLREYLYGAAAIGKGGIDKMTKADKGRVGAELQKQYRWLHGFSKNIYENRETITAQAIKARAHLYAEAGVKVANVTQAGYFYNQLPWIPGDGSTECMNRCGCMWVLTVESEDAGQGIKVVSARWVLNEIKEHCNDCIPRDGHVETLIVPVDTEVPPFIGLGGG